MPINTSELNMPNDTCRTAGTAQATSQDKAIDMPEAVSRNFVVQQSAQCLTGLEAGKQPQRLALRRAGLLGATGGQERQSPSPERAPPPAPDHRHLLHALLANLTDDADAGVCRSSDRSAKSSAAWRPDGRFNERQP